MEIGDKIRRLRVAKQLTQEELANACGKKNTAVSNWEKGIRQPDAVDLAIISNFFNISIDDLMLKDLRK